MARSNKTIYEAPDDVLLILFVSFPPGLMVGELEYGLQIGGGLQILIDF